LRPLYINAIFVYNMRSLAVVLLLLFFFTGAYAQEDTLPALKVKDVNGKMFKLNDFKGKVTFIRIWKTYDPSIVDLAFLEWLEKQYGGKIQYIYLCTGSFTDAWKKLFTRFSSVKGVQLVTDGDESKWEEFLDHYSQMAIVDKDGIIYYQNDHQFEDGLEVLLK
jgi:hypothetical protein